jgi:hypothetical protein
VKALLSSICALVAMSVASGAQATVIFNSTFDGLQPYGSWSVVASADGWTTTGGPGIELQNNVAGSPGSGGASGVFVELDSHANSTMSRTISGSGRYILEFLYSPRPGIASTSNGVLVSMNGQALAPAFTAQGGQNSVWSLKTIEFVAPTSNWQLSFSGVGRSDSLGGYVDNIRLTAVPEPATWAMMIMGFGAAGALLRRRRALAAG